MLNPRVNHFNTQYDFYSLPLMLHVTFRINSKTNSHVSDMFISTREPRRRRTLALLQAVRNIFGADHRRGR